MSARTGESCTEYFKKLNILPLQLQYILPLVISMINKKTNLQQTLEILGIYTRNKSN
jgi:hypothetical protein